MVPDVGRFEVNITPYLLCQVLPKMIHSKESDLNDGDVVPLRDFLRYFTTR
jgi:hypothetical protein